jgi:hypothetical protein
MYTACGSTKEGDSNSVKVLATTIIIIIIIMLQGPLQTQ